MKLLFADDAPVSRQLVTNILARPEIELITVADGEEAWQALAQPDRPRLLLLDWMMPKLDGIELCQKIRASNWPKYTYIILLTARTQPDDVVAAVDSGVDDYMGKPFAANDLLARIRIGERALQKEDRLGQITEAWRAMLDKIPLGVIGLRSNGAIQRTNKAIMKLLGFSDIKELLNRKIEEFISPGQINLKGFIQTILSSGSTDPLEITMLTRNGAPVEVLLWGRLVHVPTGPMFQIIVSPRGVPRRPRKKK